MKTEIYNNRENDSTAWITVTRDENCLTLEYRTQWQGGHDVTIVYDLKDEVKLIEALNHPLFSIDCITEAGWGPEPIKTTIHEEVI